MQHLGSGLQLGNSYKMEIPTFFLGGGRKRVTFKGYKLIYACMFINKSLEHSWKYSLRNISSCILSRKRTFIQETIRIPSPKEILLPWAFFIYTSFKWSLIPWFLTLVSLISYWLVNNVALLFAVLHRKACLLGRPPFYDINISHTIFALTNDAECND